MLTQLRGFHIYERQILKQDCYEFTALQTADFQLQEHTVGRFSTTPLSNLGTLH